MELKTNGRPISVRFRSDAVVAQRVAAHIQRRIEEDDWLPFRCKEVALQSWQKRGHRVQVFMAYDLVGSEQRRDQRFQLEISLYGSLLIQKQDR